LKHGSASASRKSRPPSSSKDREANFGLSRQKISHLCVDLNALESPNKPSFDLKKAAAGAFAAATIASSTLTAPLPADAFDNQFTFSSTTVVAEKVTREGLYGEYTVDIEQKYDDARSTFKEAKETKTKKGRSRVVKNGRLL
jgi:hypothetical protein